MITEFCSSRIQLKVTVLGGVSSPAQRPLQRHVERDRSCRYWLHNSSAVTKTRFELVENQLGSTEGKAYGK